MDTSKPAAPHAMPPSGRTLIAILTFISIVAVLYLGRGILVPLVFAVLLAFALGPVVNALRYMRLPHVPAVLTAVAFAILIISGIAYMASAQFLSLAAELPRYQATIGEKLRMAQETLGGGRVLDRLISTIEQVGAQVREESQPLTTEEGQPIPVVISGDGASPLEMAQSVVLSIIGPLTSVLIVTIFLIFLLLEREELRDRFLKIVSRGDLRSSTEAMNEASERVGRFLLAQFGVNVGYGAAFGLGLFLIGVPNAVLWGLLAMIFRYIPFVGTLIVATLPALLSMAVDPGWSMLIGVVGIYLLLEVISNNAIEPHLYGNSTGLTPLAVLLAAMFWATIWGPIGLIVAMPLTVCILVMARYVPHLGFIETLLGSAPVLLPQERFYQRLISGNSDEAVEVAERASAGTDIAAFYDEVALPALRLAQADIAADLANASFRHRVIETLGDVVDDLSADADLPEPQTRTPVLVFGGKTELDQAIALLVADRLEAHGVLAKVMPPVALRREGVAQIDLEGTELVCLCYLGARPGVYARYAARRLRRQKPDLKVVGGFFHEDQQDEVARSEMGELDAVVHDVSSAQAEIGRLLGVGKREAAAHAAVEELAVSAKALTSRLGTVAEVNTLLRELTSELSVTLGLVTFLPPGGIEDTAVSHAEHLAMHAIRRPGALLITDLQHSEFGHLRSVVESGVRAYGGVPIEMPQTRLRAVLAVFDQNPRTFTEDELRALWAYAKRLVPILTDIVARDDTAAKQATAG
ncbi:AI-2E family transporter [Pelagibacterium xiamenense]|uniref:AI-2E family transporter n=1 Tax=Pelagibacterium xiamenense TaxID=2901140 RepID=UPI001E38DA34|nr:AI-2E family transporter [Pelagibacterium xiamenense]MCD7060495.1 AI-2E family transporter [Pelagibacterium xiamenense]